MDAAYTRRLIKKMLDSRGLMPETREELSEYLTELDQGALHPDDAAYVEGLARRLGHSAGGPAANANDPDEDLAGDAPDDFADDEDDDTGGTAAAVQAEIALRSIERARTLLAPLREPKGEGEAPPADRAILDDVDAALGDAAEALTRRH